MTTFLTFMFFLYDIPSGVTGSKTKQVRFRGFLGTYIQRELLINSRYNCYDKFLTTREKVRFFQSLLFANFQRLVNSQLKGKEAIIVLVYKKGNIKILINYRPVSLLPVCGNFSKKLMFNGMFKFFMENDLISSNQSGYKRGNSCINQCLSIT